MQFYRLFRLDVLISLLFITMLAGCGSQPGPEQPGTVKRSAPQQNQYGNSSVQELIARANRSDGNTAQQLRIRAAELSLANGDISQARSILDVVGEPAGEPSRALAFVHAQLQILSDDPVGALRWLNQIRSGPGDPLTTDEQLRLGDLKAEAYRANRSYLASARERIFFNSLLTEDQKQDNHEKIFSTLLSLPARTLQTQAEKAVTSDLRGWLSLAAMTRRFQNDPVQQLNALENWKKLWSSHPAISHLPASLQLLSQVVSDQPESIALFLPLEGNLSVFGRAIRDGILSAHFQADGHTRIKLYDTSSNDILTLLASARADGAELAIGPLDRDKVTELASQPSLPIPVLALNRSIDGSANPDLYQFGLAPEDEIHQVATQASKEGHHNALVIYPAGDWGNRNFATFRQQWEADGGIIIDSAEYTNQRDYSDLVKNLLNVDASEQRAAELRRIIGERFEFTPRRRQDIDFIFLLANASQARGINPTLAFFYAEDIPVYATSSVYEYSDSKIESIDLNGIRFCDIPWKLGEPDTTQALVEQYWPAAKSQLAPFFALGVDAYRLYPRLQQLRRIPGERVFGSTGILQLQSGNVISRQLIWGQIRNGEVTAIPTVVEAGR
ncbi:MAG: penicillin-binding protein activator [Pseudomonadales bacterium]|nr:penicillin-binding protein activator [Pseudomonadales bacterium]